MYSWLGSVSTAAELVVTDERRRREVRDERHSVGRNSPDQGHETLVISFEGFLEDFAC